MRHFLHFFSRGIRRFAVAHFILLVTLLIPSTFNSLKAQTISVAEAKEKAVALKQSKNMAGQSGSSSLKTELVYTGESSGTPTYYVFNYSEGGFSIIGADKMAKSVLGYSEEGLFSYDKIPDGLKYMLSVYNEQISKAKSDPKSEAFLKESLNESTKASVLSLVQTKWDQGYPYNSRIPLASGTTSRFLTGCGATAVAQILKYYNSPVRGTGSKSYARTYSVNGVSTTVNFIADFGNTTYSWNDMLDDYSYGYTDTQADAVGLLMYHAGVALEMEYGWSASSSYSNMVVPAFVNNFGYNPNAYIAERYNYSDAEWETLVYNEISAGRPLWYRGSTNDGSGHAFICDGYDASQDAYHFNWGWGGYCDGYYPLTGSGAVDPYQTPDGNGGFINGQAAIIGLIPSSMIVPVSKISLNVSTATLSLGSTKTLRATVSPSNATDKTVAWSSDNERVARVNNSGVITAVGAGTANIICTANDGSGKQKTCAITVTSNLAERSNLISSNTAEANVSFSTEGSYEWDWDSSNNRLMSTNSTIQGSTSETTVNITTFAPATEFSFDYKVSSESNWDKLYVLLDNSYVISGLSGSETGNFSTSLTPGNHVLVLRYQKDNSVDRNDDKAYISNMKLDLPIVLVSNIVLNTNSVSLAVGATHKLKATISPSYATDKTVKWTSDNTTVAKVSSSGTVTAMGIGSAVIKCTAKDGSGVKDSCVVNVVQPVTGISLSNDSVTLWKGETIKLTKEITPSTATDKTVIWDSSNTGVATVSTAGKISAKKAGTAIIRCIANDGLGAKDSCVVIVKQMVTSIALSNDSVYVLTGKTFALTATTSPSNASEPGVKWKSSDKTIATVSSAGKIKGISEGTCIITCTAADGKGATASCIVVVCKPVSSITLASSTLDLAVGTSKTLKATVSPTDAFDRSVTWTSSNETVATVSSTGKILAKKPGTTKIRCATNDGSGKYADCVVTVSALTFTESNPEIAKGTYGAGGLALSKSVSEGKYYPFSLPYSISIAKCREYFSHFYVPMGMALYQSSGTLLILFKEVTSGTISKGQPFVAMAANTGKALLPNYDEIKISTLTNPAAKSLELYDFNAKTGMISLNSDFSVKIGVTYSKIENPEVNIFKSLSTSGVLANVTSLNPYRFYVTMENLVSQRLGEVIVKASFSREDSTPEEFFEEILESEDETDEDVILFDLNGNQVNQGNLNGIYIKNGKKYIKKD